MSTNDNHPKRNDTGLLEDQMELPLRYKQKATSSADTAKLLERINDLESQVAELKEELGRVWTKIRDHASVVNMHRPIGERRY